MTQYDVVVDISLRDRNSLIVPERAAQRLRYPLENLNEMTREELGESLAEAVRQTVSRLYLYPQEKEATKP